MIKQWDVRVHVVLLRHAFAVAGRRDRGPDRAVLVVRTNGRVGRSVHGRGPGEHPVHRAGRGRRAGPVGRVPVVAHGTGTVDGQPAAVPVQRPEAGASGRVRGAGYVGLDAAAPSGRRRPRLQSRGRRDVPDVGRQLLGGRDPTPPVDLGGGGQPGHQRHRHAQRAGDGGHRSGGRGQRRSAVDNRRTRAGALPAPARQPDQQRRGRGDRAVPGAGDRGRLRRAAAGLERVGVPVVGGRAEGVLCAAVRPAVRVRGRPRRTAAGRQSVRGRRPGLPVLRRHVRKGRLRVQTVLVAVHAPDQQTPGQTLVQLDSPRSRSARQRSVASRIARGNTGPVPIPRRALGKYTSHRLHQHKYYNNYYQSMVITEW
uniref:Uncharacterized protein n=1 Tax=Schizaphis graminum TaxID=13262 RepID=A0A2S2NPK4_SCHGA